jgi:ADP-ribose pyrophosphatase
MPTTKFRKLTQRDKLNLFEASWEFLPAPKEGEKKTKPVKGKWLFCSRKQKPQYTAPTWPDTVTVIPIIPKTESAESKIVLIKAFRPPVQCFTVSFPTGLVGKDEAWENAAKRELREITGHDLTTVLGTSPVLYTLPGVTEENTVEIVCHCVPSKNPPELEDPEFLRVMTLNMSETKTLVEDIKAGRERTDSKCWLILNMFLSWGEFRA